MAIANRIPFGSGSQPKTPRRSGGSADSQPPKPKLYADHEKIYPRRVKGAFRRVKWATLWVLLGIYYLAPWIRWDRGPGAPDQALLIDMPGRRAYFFGLEIWPQEVYYLTGLLILGAVGLFLVTALAGRVWCGFTCPQTVWTDLFLWVERLIEGDRNARIKLDKGPLTANKAGKKVAKHVVWLFISVATGGAWILYFNDAFTYIGDFFTGRASVTSYSFVGLFTATTYLLAGWAREQVCIYMCPWPRFQGAMFDEHSLVVTYEEWRGEPRGKAKAGQSFEGRGDCVDCSLCVQVCPTGVDIREGQQMACIGCALCVDACNNVMAKIGRPANLITYDSSANQIARATGKPTRMRPIRARTLAYAGVVAVVIAVMATALVDRARVEVNVLADRAPLYVTLSDGSIRNGYTFKVLNMERKAKTFTLTTSGLDGALLTVIGYQEKPVRSVTLPVSADDVSSFRVFVKTGRKALHGPDNDMVFVLRDKATGKTIRHDTFFSGPGY